MKRLFVIALLVGAAWFHVSQLPSPHVLAAPPAIALRPASAAEPPLQRSLEAPALFHVNGYELRTLQAFALKARVLSIERYRLGRDAELAPLDIAFGWGRMADPAVSDRLSISQRARWYHWRYSGEPPIPRREIETSSANMHLIPASRAVARMLAGVDKGDIVSLRGYLVEVRAADGWRWRSSLSREDTGEGSCELVFVQAIERH